MSERIPSLYVKDILNCIERIQLYTSDYSFNDFTANFRTVEACLYNFHIIGEAVTKLPENIKDAEPHVPWKLIKGMRNRLIHEYFGTDLTIVWSILQNELPALKTNLENIYQKLLQQGK
jgi:uncharacterized protein with HEPN domain